LNAKTIARRILTAPRSTIGASHIAVAGKYFCRLTFARSRSKTVLHQCVECRSTKVSRSPAPLRERSCISRTLSTSVPDYCSYFWIQAPVQGNIAVGLANSMRLIVVNLSRLDLATLSRVSSTSYASLTMDYSQTAWRRGCTREMDPLCLTKNLSSFRAFA
jgi:hypothetical protein